MSKNAWQFQDPHEAARQTAEEFGLKPIAKDWIETITREAKPAYPNVWVQFSMPLKVVSEANKRGSWRWRYFRQKEQQKELHAEWKRHTRGLKISLP